MQNKTQYVNDYFDQFYENNDDPWGYQSHWYEERKRQICLAMLLKPQYEKTLEIGCANGCFTKELATRTKSLISIDGHAKAVELTQNRVQDHKNVLVERRVVPYELPKQQFDLIILSEVAYYLSLDELSQLTDQLSNQLCEQGMLLSCHWRHPIQDFDLDGHEVHLYLKSHLNLNHYASMLDPDFLIDIWTSDTQSLAQQEGIL